jgi:hypothetical protein
VYQVSSEFWFSASSYNQALGTRPVFFNSYSKINPRTDFLKLTSFFEIPYLGISDN